MKNNDLIKRSRSKNMNGRWSRSRSKSRSRTGSGIELGAEAERGAGAVKKAGSAELLEYKTGAGAEALVGVGT